LLKLIISSKYFRTDLRLLEWFSRVGERRRVRVRPSDRSSHLQPTGSDVTPLRRLQDLVRTLLCSRVNQVRSLPHFSLNQIKSSEIRLTWSLKIFTTYLLKPKLTKFQITVNKLFYMLLVDKSHLVLEISLTIPIWSD
jgi:hypothetical protein